MKIKKSHARRSNCDRRRAESKRRARRARRAFDETCCLDREGPYAFFDDEPVYLLAYVPDED